MGREETEVDSTSPLMVRESTGLMRRKTSREERKGWKNKGVREEERRC